MKHWGRNLCGRKYQRSTNVPSTATILDEKLAAIYAINAGSANADRCEEADMDKDLENMDTLMIRHSESCDVCKNLLKHIQQFFDILQSAQVQKESDWLTVDDVATELRISKTVVYRLIRNGELEAVNVVENNGRVAQRGHYRINRLCLNQYLDSKKVRPFPSGLSAKPKSRRFPEVRNHLGL